MRLTVGPLPAAVYWRRRAIVLGAALLAVFLAAQACFAATAASPGGDTAGDDSSPAPPVADSPGVVSGEDPVSAIGGLLAPVVGSDTASPQPTEEDDATSEMSDQPSASDDRGPRGDECSDEEMLITAAAERTEFAAGDPVRLTIRIRNDADRSCVRDIGGDQRELYLIHGTGASRIFSSRDCEAPEGSQEQLLEPGFETEHYLVWNGLASSSCDGGQAAGPEVEPGAYQLYATLGQARSQPLDLTVG